jgi:hypothetical protein
MATVGGGQAQKWKWQAWETEGNCWLQDMGYWDHCLCQVALRGLEAKAQLQPLPKAEKNWEQDSSWSLFLF